MDLSQKRKNAKNANASLTAKNAERKVFLLQAQGVIQRLFTLKNKYYKAEESPWH
jgi:predicted metal-dependent hydrolase